MNTQNCEEYILSLKYTRLFLFFGIYLCFGFYAYLFITLKPYHPNLRYLLLFYIPTLLLTSFTTLIRDFTSSSFLTESPIFNEIIKQSSDIGIASMSFALLALVVERVIAAIFVGKYEGIHEGKAIIGICLYLVSLTLTIAVNIVTMCRIFSLHTALAITNSSLVVGSIFFVILPFFTKRQYKQHVKNRFRLTVTVSEKYMQLENLHSAKMMRLLGPFLAISAALFVAFYSYVTFYTTDLTQLLITHIFYTLEPVVSLGILLISAFCHHRVRYAIRTHLLFWHRSKVPDGPRISIGSPGGDEYFLRLREAWK